MTALYLVLGFLAWGVLATLAAAVSAGAEIIRRNRGGH